MLSTLLRCTCRNNLTLKYIINKSTINKQVFRTFIDSNHTEHERKFIVSQRQLFKKDGISQDYTLIYRAPAENYITRGLAVMFFSTSLFLVGVLISLFVGVDTEVRSYSVSEYLVSAKTTDAYYLGIFLIVFLVVSSAIFSRFVMRIYNNGDNYVAFYRGLRPWQLKRVEFKTGDAKLVPVRRFFPMRLSDIKINNKNTILFENSFRRPVDCHKMIGAHLRQDED